MELLVPRATVSREGRKTVCLGAVMCVCERKICILIHVYVREKYTF